MSKPFKAMMHDLKPGDRFSGNESATCCWVAMGMSNGLMHARHEVDKLEHSFSNLEIWVHPPKPAQEPDKIIYKLENLSNGERFKRPKTDEEWQVTDRRSVGDIMAMCISYPDSNFFKPGEITDWGRTAFVVRLPSPGHPIQASQKPKPAQKIVGQVYKARELEVGDLYAHNLSADKEIYLCTAVDGAAVRCQVWKAVRSDGPRFMTTNPNSDCFYMGRKPEVEAKPEPKPDPMSGRTMMQWSDQELQAELEYRSRDKTNGQPADLQAEWSRRVSERLKARAEDRAKVGGTGGAPCDRELEDWE